METITRKLVLSVDGEYIATRGVIPRPPLESSSESEEDSEEEIEIVTLENEKKGGKREKLPDEKKKEKKEEEKEEKEKKKKKKKRKKPEGEYYSYKGCSYKVGFKVDRPITITGLEFFGPKQAVPEFAVRVQIQRTVEDWMWIPKFLRFIWPWGPYYKIEELLPLSRVSAFNVKKGKSFKVALADPVEVEAEKYTDIKFELLGPNTKRMTKMYGRCEILVSSNSQDWSTVTNFEFLEGSRQLSGIYFKPVESMNAPNPSLSDEA